MNPTQMSMVPAALATIGDVVFVNHEPAIVTEVRTYAPDSPEALAAPIKPGRVVRAIVTPAGVRHFGHLPGERYRGAEIGTLAPEGVSFE